jgi:hypothetical protein
MNASQFLIDWVRTLTGQRRKRVLPRRSAKPAIGARIVLVDVGKRLTIPAGLSDALWVWLLDAGWRVERYRPDRRHYRDISRLQVEHLLTCDPALRARLLDQSDHLREQPNFGFPASQRTFPGAQARQQASERIRFLKPTELQGDRFSGQRPGS